jgi:hypothetical protein
MTEAEWAESCDLHKMLLFLRDSGRASERKLRLFACACLRGVWGLLTEERSRRGLEVSERYADGLADGEELWQAAIHARKVDDAAAKAVWLAQGLEDSLWRADRAAATAADAAGWAAAKAAPRGQDRVVPAMQAAEAERQASHCRLLRCVFGDPFRPPTLDLTCRTPQVLRLAEAAYRERTLPGGELDPQRLAVLADALEEAGADGAILDHLRGPGPHVRGCHVVDLLLNRA